MSTLHDPSGEAAVRTACRRLNATRVLGSAALAAVLLASVVVRAGEAPRLGFASPEAAAEALVSAERADDRHELLKILGPGGRKLVYSGDPVADHAARQRIVAAYDAAHRIVTEGRDTAALILGSEEWSLPIPIVKQADHWRFDTEAGLQKIIDRRVGRNELNVIEVCRAYVAAQREYHASDRQGDGLHEYAMKFRSSPGKRDGLFWQSAAGEEPSPLGPLVAAAHAQGYGGGSDRAGPSPYHGYYFRILTAQGPHASGGAKDYVVDGHMTRGFALLAYPAKWGDSGIMTFMVNASGIVFERNLGPHTERLAQSIQSFDPDLGWATP